jgi:hypothetical protein
MNTTSEMQTFEFYIDDDRYGVPTLHLATLADEGLARQIAETLLGDSPHHRGVEVCEGGARLFGIGTLSLAPIPGPEERAP